jgi:hypothetical protein
MKSLSGWSLQDDLWRQVDEILKGADWRSTWLDSLFQDSVPKEPGIYIIHTGQSALSAIYHLPDGISGVLYVGRSNNLRNRFKQHATINPDNRHIQACSSIFGRLRFTSTPISAAASITPDEWLSAAEHILISVLNPPANSSIPTGSKLVGRIGQAVPAA